MHAWSPALIALVALACDPSRPERVRPDASVEVCPHLFDAREDVWLETSCLPERCVAVATQDGCAVELAVSGCETGSLAGTLDARGRVTFEASALFGECTVIDEPDALVSAACVSELRSCRVDVHRPGAPLAVELTRVPLFDVPFEGPSGSEVQLLDQLDPLRGYLTSAAVLGDVVAVAAHDGRSRSIDCTSQDPSRLFFVDAIAAAVTSSTSAPACLVRITPDPLGPGLLGVFGSEPLSIGRFDATGALVASAPLAAPAETRHFAVALLPGAEQTAVVVVSHGFPATSSVLFVDTASLETESTSPVIDGRIRHAITVDDVIVASEIYEQQVLKLDTRTGVVRDVVRLSTSRRVSGDAGFLVALPDRDQLAVATTGTRGAAWVLDTAEGATAPITGTAVFFEAVAVPWAMAPSPLEAGLVVGALTSSAPEYTAHLARLDPAGPRWLAGSAPIGRGAVAALLPRGDELWALLPWSAELVRIHLLR